MTIKEIDTLIEEGNSLKQIAQAYAEIANQKIRKIRSQVERNRRFFEEISFVYGLVRILAEKKKLNILKAKKRIALVITSNYRFYGQIHLDLLEFFTKSIKDMDTDIVILGKAAIDYFKASHRSSTAEILLKNDQPDSEELNNLVKIIKDYKQVLVFYSKLKTILVQQPSIIDLSQSALSQTTDSQMDFKFIFEPDLPKILEFFDSQILTLLLEETFLEAELARTASRFISMDEAETNANKFIKDSENKKAYVLRNIKNSQILETLAALSALRKEI